MRRLLIIFFIFALTIVWQNFSIVKAFECTGVGNYCLGKLVQEFGNGCLKEEGACIPLWSGVYTMHCDASFTIDAWTGYFGGKCINTPPPTCTVEPYEMWTTYNCCFMPPSGGGGGGWGLQELTG